MQQTPIQELIEKLKNSIYTELEVIDRPNLYHEGDVRQARITVSTTQFAIDKATSLLPAEQQYVQQHAEGFGEFVLKNPPHLTIPEIYTKYIFE